MKKKSRVKNGLINLLLLLMLLIGLALVFNNQIKNFLLKTLGEDYAVSQVTATDVQENLAYEASFDFDAVEPLSLDSILRRQLDSKHLPVIGGIAIPSVEINLPIFKGLGNAELSFGAGTFDPNQKMGEGNYSLASHRVDDTDMLFTPLDVVELGAVIYLTDLENIYAYTITHKERIDPSRVEVVDEVPGEKLVTLITCGERDAVTRWWVKGELTDIVSVDDATEEMLHAFEMEQQTF